ncbi:Cd2+/Zn2+-exporting ATPase [Marininema mesophilum]|uniref:Cd(2+)-exporting ATPase n=1 Tax=Marininema mesophilum TaxID=1048340 RepID=A0A1H2S9V7_9BACL|nr:cation-translocating P-type ATPase [Marininema mesophilum]SDW28453.1 Cd2+/Zn2+-exporting ATPase [Marininema mesophilum]
MNEYRLNGLSCPGCASKVEGQIKKIPHGETARILFQSGKLIVDEQINLEKVKKILSEEKISLRTTDQESDNHGHDHSHAHGQGEKRNLIIATLLFLVGYLIEERVSLPLSIGFYVIAILLTGTTTFRKGIRNLLRLQFNMDTLMTIALIGAVSIGEWREGTFVAILFGLNEFLEGFGMEKARRSMEKLMEAAPREATLVTENGDTTIISIDHLKAGDIVLVRPGEKIPSDGVIIEGSSSINEAAITGESLPLYKGIEDSVYGGSINNEGVIKVRIETPFSQSAISRILQLVQEAQDQRTPTELFIDRFSRYYTPFIIAVAAIVIILPPLFGAGSWKEWLYQGLAVLIVGCPCALILSSPIANIAGITRNARNGILVKGSNHLEQLGKITTIAFDKTGTLTKGTPHVVKAISYHTSFLAIAGALEKDSTHPLAKAIVNEVQEKEKTLLEATSLTTLPGKGVTALVDGKRYWAGNESTAHHLTIPEQIQRDIDQLKEAGAILVMVTDEEQVLGLFGLADEIREESAAVIRALHEAGIQETIMLTGDHPQTAEKVAQSVGVKTVHASLLPEDKVKRVQSLSAQSKTAMVGDGINDAPALAAADLGIAMGKGTDSAIETADIVLMQDHIEKLPEAISISRRVNQTIRLNIAFSLGLKLLALLLTIPGWLTLWIAILSDMGATILVTLISLTILWEKRPPQQKPSSISLAK